MYSKSKLLPTPLFLAYCLQSIYILYCILLRTGIFPTSKFDSTVDEGKGRLNPSRHKNEGKHRGRKVEKSCVTPAGTSTSLTSRINGMTTHTHTHTHTQSDQRFS